VLTNRKELVLHSAALLALIDEKIEALSNDRPNSPEAKKGRDEAITAYEGLRRDLTDLQATALGFVRGDVKEAAVAKSARTFAEGVRDWWNKAHVRICDRAIDMAVFTASVGICSLAGSGGKMAVAVGAVLVV
jgi:hypothetical protein